MAVKKKEKETVIQISKIEQGELDFHVIGITPLILHRMSQKAMLQLLLPPDKRGARGLKHDPLEEYRESPYTSTDAKSPTRLLMIATAFKAALKSVAVDIPGAAKAQIGRLTYVVGDYIPIWGIPKLSMAVTRSSDINRTPDVRTRAIVPQWAAKFTVKFTMPNITPTAVTNLLHAAGLIRGIGDWRPEKGSGNYGQFELVEASDKRFIEIVKNGGRAAQDKALEDPECYDKETADLFSMFNAEIRRRGLKVA